jgi:hypothetical protein
MSGKYDGTGVKVNDFVEIPDGEYTLRIIEANQGMTKNGDDMVTVSFEIVGGDHNLEKINYHNVIFFKDKGSKGAGIALKFLKSIGEPCEGSFVWDEKNWIGKKLKGTVVQELATQGKHVGKKFPKVKWVDACEDGPGGVPAEEVPF